MKLNLYYSALSVISAEKLILDLEKREKTEKHIIITPDKSSLYYERKLFSLLNEESFFDVTTTTLSRFANGVVGKQNNILTKQGGVLIVKRILMENKASLVSFGKASELIGFAGSLFDTICMFKSCHIEPSQIEEVKNITLNNKLKDIKFVYEKYEEYLKTEYTDSFNRLNLCATKINKEEFKNTNFYFVGFDDFTKQGYLIIEKLLKNSKSVNIATTYVKKVEKNNHNIYLNSVYYNCLDIARINGVECNRIEVDNNLNDEKRFLSQQLFASKQVSYNGNQEYVKLLKYNNVDDEIKNTIIDIKYNIINNDFRYKNFAIIVPELGKYKDKIKLYSKRIGIEIFIDENVKLKDTMLSRFIFNIISIFYKPTKYNVVNFIKSILFDINSIEVDKYMSFIDKYEPKYDGLFNYESDELKEYFELLNNYYKQNSEDSITALLDNLRQFLDDIHLEERIDNLMKIYYNNSDLENYRLLKQSYIKILKIFDEIRVLNDYKCSYLEVLKFFELYAENTNIVVPPIVADAVFVTDISCENLLDVDYVYFLGFNEGSVPKYSVDSGIISDEEIGKMPIQSRLNPTINVINKRMKFRLFELMFVANKKIIVSFSLKGDDGDMYPNSLISNFQVIYNISNVENGSNKLDILNNNLLSFNNDNFIYNNISKGITIDNYVKLLKYWDNYNDNKSFVKNLSILDELVGDKTYVDNLKFVNDINFINSGLFLRNNKIGISEIERFNTCPYLHFVDYGLKLKPSEKNDLSALDLGNIIHEFVKIVIFKLDEEDIVKKTLNFILRKEEYKYLVENEQNNFVIKSLYEECERIKNVLIYQNKLSQFEVDKVEMPFSMQICNLNGKDIVLTGIIDRIDKFEDGIRVIDYKTGKVEFKNFEDIYYGNKVQVVVYLSALSKMNGLQPLGALYFPISNAFSSTDSEDLYQMQGVIYNKLQNLYAFDKNLSTIGYSSKIINLSSTTKGEISNNAFFKNMCLNEQEINKLFDYVNELINETIVKIGKHEIEPYPIDDNVCNYCEYKGLCNFSLKYGNKFRKTDKIKTLSDMLGGEDE